MLLCNDEMRHSAAQSFMCFDVSAAYSNMTPHLLISVGAR